MFRTPADPMVFRRYFIRQVVLPIGVVVCIVLIAASLGLYWSTSKSDEVALSRQTESVKQALIGNADQLTYEQKSIADWDQLVREINQPIPDKEWLVT